MSSPAKTHRYVDRFVDDLVASLSVHRHRSPTVVWPSGGDAVARTVVARLTREDAAPATAELAEGLAIQLDVPVIASLTRVPVAVEYGPEAVMFSLRGSCHLHVEKAFDLRLRMGEVIYVPGGSGWTAGAGRGDCLLVLLLPQ